MLIMNYPLIRLTPEEVDAGLVSVSVTLTVPAPDELVR